MGLEVAIDERLNEGLHGFSGEFSGLRLVLGHLFLEVDEAHSRELVLLHAEEFEDALMIVFVSVNSDEQDLHSERLLPLLSSMTIKDHYLALELLGDVTGSTGDLLSIGVALANEQEKVVLDFTAENLLGTFVIKFND